MLSIPVHDNMAFQDNVPYAEPLFVQSGRGNWMHQPGLAVFKEWYANLPPGRREGT
jgi:hypothetical protein